MPTPRPLSMAPFAVLLVACGDPRGLPAAGAGGDSAFDPPAVDGDAAEIVSLSFPSDLACEGSDVGRIVVRNTGTTTWTRDAGYKLGTVEDEDPFYTADTRVWLPEGVQVAPGDEYLFEATLTGVDESGSYLSDWQMVKEGEHWFGRAEGTSVSVRCDEPGTRKGASHLDGSKLYDDAGPYTARGATMMWAAWGYKYDRTRLEANLAALADAGFDYFRALGSVGDPDAEDYWDDREIDPNWGDYDEVIAGLTDLAWQQYGLRVEWTLIGDGQLSVPQEVDRYALVDRFVAMSRSREEAIVHFEIANEYWQNGFEGDQGLAQLRALSSYMRGQTDILVAASAPAGHTCADIDAVYGGGVADLATIHFDRDTSGIEGSWRPVRQPWDLAACTSLVGSNNEPIGPGSSVASEEDPERLAAAAVTTWVSGLPLYVFHSRAGVRGDYDLWEMAGFYDFLAVDRLVPGDLPGWTRREAAEPGAPFQMVAEDRAGVSYPDLSWSELADPGAGADRVYAGEADDRFFAVALGILDHATLVARRDMDVTAWSVHSGEMLGSWRLGEGEQVVVEGAGAAVLGGRYR